MLRNILLGAGVLATLLSILIFSGKIPLGKANTPMGEVVMWGTFPEVEMNGIIQAFNPQAKTYAVRYTYIPEVEFNQRLLEALASGVGPDLILAPYQKILANANRIQVFPAASFSEKSFKDTFVDGSSIFFTKSGALAFPVAMEPMVLFYNRTLLSKHGIANPPQYWDEVGAITPALTIRENNVFKESAISLGTPSVPYAKDILMAIVTQLGQVPLLRLEREDQTAYYTVLANEPVNETSEIKPLTTASRFFSQFGDAGQTYFTWNQNDTTPAVDKFLAEKLAMYIGYSGEFPVLKARNPRAEFEMTTLPQTKGYNTFSTGMRMYGVATLRSSKNMQAAFAVQGEFSGAGVSPALAEIVGGVSALRSYANTPGLDPVISRSMLVARGWYDSYERESTQYTATMISDIINYRYGVNDAVSLFVNRLQDLYR